MRRLEFATNDSGRFPRHLYAPDWLSDIVCGLDGSRTVAGADQRARARTCPLRRPRCSSAATCCRERCACSTRWGRWERSDRALGAGVRRTAVGIPPPPARRPDRRRGDLPAAELGAAETAPGAARPIVPGTRPRAAGVRRRAALPLRLGVAGFPEPRAHDACPWAVRPVPGPAIVRIRPRGARASCCRSARRRRSNAGGTTLQRFAA